eukprot:NODE_10202_length_1369_cov_6.494364.p1 GENE.NODE_10202_length_1369_cov_6.494364~~NODE_10202_length_1369_cov_6.494364.p1  ORF type:complete len:368 (-),score=115.65 NODE_10202_length_1369_cov_6.494364:266-1297(-)
MEGRFYENEFPELEDRVVVQVKRIVDMGAYVSLLEYNGREGMLLLSELSKRRIRSVAKLLKVGRTEICMVLRVDEDKGYIDLSKRRVAPDEAAAKDEVFAKAKAVHGIMRHVGLLNNVGVDVMCAKMSWPLYAKYPSAHEAFRRHANGEINMWDEVDLTEVGDEAKIAKIKEDVETCLSRRLVTQTLRLRAKIEVSCNEYDGIEAIRAALTDGLRASKEDCELKIHLVAHPVFVLTVVCRSQAQGIAVIDEAMQFVELSITKSKGHFKVRNRPELIESEVRRGADEASGSSESGSDIDSVKQDITMGNLNDDDVKALMARTKHLDEPDDQGDKKGDAEPDVTK